MEYTPIIQVISILAAGVGAATFVDRKISAVEKKLLAKIDQFDSKSEKRLANIRKDFVPNGECVLIHRETDRRLDGVETKLGDMAQKTQIIIARQELADSATGD